MAARTIATTDTLETLRTEFNALSSQDFGDIASLDAGLAATSVIGAVNEIYGITLATAGFTISDGSNTQDIASGETLTVNGTSNEIEATVSATDTLTIGLPDVVAVTTSLTIGGVAVPTISSSSTLTNKTLTSPVLTSPVISTISNTGTLTLPTSTDTLVGRATTDTLTNKTLTQPTITQPTISAPTITSDMTLGASVSLKFEGATDNDFETALTVVDPTADRTITFPNATGTVVLADASQTLTNKTIDASQLSGTINNARLDAQLQDVAGLAVTNGGFIVGDGSNFVLETGATARTSLGLGTSDDVQFDSFGVGTGASGTTGEIRATNDITAFYSSDIALKENIHNIPSASDKIEQLNGVLFDWKQDFIDSKGGEDGYFMRKSDVGVIAQDVEKVLPEIVGTRSDGIKAVKYDRLVALLIEGFKELKQEIKELKTHK